MKKVLLLFYFNVFPHVVAMVSLFIPQIIVFIIQTHYKYLVGLCMNTVKECFKFVDKYFP